MTVQPPAGMVLPLAMLKLPAPAVAVTPVQVPVLPAVLMVMPAGKASVRADVSTMAPALALPMDTVTLVLPPLAILATEKVLLMVGAVAVTVTQAPVLLVPPPAAEFVISAPMLVVAEILLLPLVLFACGQVPSVNDAAVVMATVIVQVPLMLLRLATVMVLPSAVAVTVPPVQVPPTTEGDDTRNPVGSVSVKLTATAAVLMTE